MLLLQGWLYDIFASLPSLINIFLGLCKDYFAMGTYLVVEVDKQDLSMINILPDDVLIEILARLPVKSLSRFQCVSKSWRNILEDSTFITKHHLTQVNFNHGNCVFVQCNEDNDLPTKFGLLTEDEQGINFTRLELPFHKESTFNTEHQTYFYDFAGPCNGIVLVYKRRYWHDEDYAYEECDDFLVWNPATREYKLLPPPTLPVRGKLSYSFVGFGIDPITKDFKVVTIWDYGDGISPCRAEVISLCASSCRPKSESWKIINDPPTFQPSQPNQILYFNGKCYWVINQWFNSDSIDLGSFDTCSSEKIMWFDMGAEVFGWIELPYVCSNPYWNGLGVLKGSIVVISTAYSEDNKYMYEIWIMDECDGVSWKKYAIVGPFKGSQFPLGFWKDEESIVRVPLNDSGSWGFEFYDTKTNMMKKRSQGLGVNPWEVVIYSESLVSVVGDY